VDAKQGFITQNKERLRIKSLGIARTMEWGHGLLNTHICGSSLYLQPSLTVNDFAKTCTSSKIGIVARI